MLCDGTGCSLLYIWLLLNTQSTGSEAVGDAEVQVINGLCDLGRAALLSVSEPRRLLLPLLDGSLSVYPFCLKVTGMLISCVL